MPAIPEDDPNRYYRRTADWHLVRSHWVSLPSDIPQSSTIAGLRRQKDSHRGVKNHPQLTTLYATAVNQDFLDEICELQNLEILWLGWPVTAHDLSGLAKLRRLRFLKLDSPRNLTDFHVLTEIPALETLFVENAKHLSRLDWLESFKDRLTALGIEGSMWTMQKLQSLEPLREFQFEALFLTSVRLADKNLMPLATCPNLKYLACARFAPKDRFDQLKAARPDIRCRWFDQYEIEV